MKKIAALLMVLSLSVFSIGCTKDDTTGDADGAGGSTPKADADGTPAADADGTPAADADA